MKTRFVLLGCQVWFHADSSHFVRAGVGYSTSSTGTKMTQTPERLDLFFLPLLLCPVTRQSGIVDLTHHLSDSDSRSSVRRNAIDPIPILAAATMLTWTQRKEKKK